MLLDKYLKKIDFKSYQEFKSEFEVTIPSGFNFAFDVVDETARINPEKTAMVWCDDKGGEAVYDR